MTFIIAFLFAQSLFGDLSRGGAKPSEPVAAPYAPANVEANAAVIAEQQSQPADAIPAPEEQVVPQIPAQEQEVETQLEPQPVAEIAESEPESEPASAPETEQPPEKADEKPSALEMPRSVKITSERTDYDRREGVIMFDKDVFVDDAEYKMHSDQLYVFLDGTNELKRIVAIGNVSITNETRVGSCAKAAYTKSVGKVVMYGDSNGVRARLADYGKRKSEVEGRKITFWIDSEQVEVEGSTVTLDAGGYSGKDGAKKLLGK